MLFRLVLILLLLGAAGVYLFWMPGRSFKGAAPETPEAAAVGARLQEFVRTLSEEIGPRSLTQYDSLKAAAEYIERTLTGIGYTTRRQLVASPGGLPPSWNIEGERRGSSAPEKIIVLGAHYDTVGAVCPGANDNGSGVAAVLMLAERLKDFTPACTLRFVAFTNEEPPYFHTEHMGSLHYAKEAAAKEEEIIAMFSLETIGYYSNAPGSQGYPLEALRYLYPDAGNFIGFVATPLSTPLLRRAIGHFRERAQIPSEGIAAPGFVPGINWSDHWAFRSQGYPAVMVTDTALFRYPEYHQTDDRWDRLNYTAMAHVVLGLEHMVKQLCE